MCRESVGSHRLTRSSLASLTSSITSDTHARWFRAFSANEGFCSGQTQIVLTTLSGGVGRSHGRTLALWITVAFSARKGIVKMLVNEMTEWPHSRARKTVDMVRLTVKHPADFCSQVIVIEYDELNAWITRSRADGFSVEAEKLGAVRSWNGMKRPSGLSSRMYPTSPHRGQMVTRRRA